MHTALHFLLWPLASASVVALGVLPHWVHAVDEKPASALAAHESVPAGGTRNVVLTGIPKMDAAVVKTSVTRMNYSTVQTDERVLVPIVSEKWKQGEPVHFILSTAARDLKQSDALVRAEAGVVQAESWKGSIRNALWEGGFSTKERATSSPQPVHQSPRMPSSSTRRAPTGCGPTARRGRRSSWGCSLRRRYASARARKARIPLSAVQSGNHPRHRESAAGRAEQAPRRRSADGLLATTSAATPG